VPDIPLELILVGLAQDAPLIGFRQPAEQVHVGGRLPDPGDRLEAIAGRSFRFRRQTCCRRRCAVTAEGGNDVLGCDRSK
jgi:hypothetical protein